MADVSPRIVVLNSNIAMEDVPGRQAFLAGALPAWRDRSGRWDASIKTRIVGYPTVSGINLLILVLRQRKSPAEARLAFANKNVRR